MERHAWCRVRVHVYICTKCGCGKENIEGRPGCWQTRFHRPNGKTEWLSTPPCESGPFTTKYLAKYESAIAVGGLPKEPRDAAAEIETVTTDAQR